MGFLDEIREQPEALHRTLDHLDHQSLEPWVQRFADGTLKRLIFTGMGSSFHAAYPALLYLNEQGIQASAFEASELAYYMKLDSRTLLVAVSQSGQSVEVVKLLEQLDPDVPVVGITNNPDSPLARRSQTLLSLKAGAELTVSSKTYTCTLAVLHVLARALCGEDTAPALEALHRQALAIQGLIPQWQAEAAALAPQLSNIQFLVYLGRGPSKASAMTAALITKESTKLPTEGMPAGQFRHGPMEVVSDGVAICLFAAVGRADALNLKLAHDLVHLPGHIVTLTDASFVTDARKILVPRETAVNEWLAPIAEIIPVQLLAARLAEIRGYDTSRFVYGSKVTVNE